MSAFRALFVAHQANRHNQRSPAQGKPNSKSSGLDNRTWPIWLGGITKAHGKHIGNHHAWKSKVLPTAPTPTSTRVQTYKPPFLVDGANGYGNDVECESLRPPSKRVMLTGDLHCQEKVRNNTPSKSRTHSGRLAFRTSELPDNDPQQSLLCD